MAIFTLPSLHESTRWKHMRIGLLGGTFDPPHAGHVHISLAAMKSLDIDAVWWLVTPQNPLKGNSRLPLDDRVRLCRSLVVHPRILVSDIEKDLGSTTTYETVCHIKHRYPATQFVWISGMDNALNLHRWNRWRKLLKEICTAYLTRAPAASLIQSCPLRMLATQKHIVITKSGAYPLDSGTTYWMMQKKMVNISSTELRNRSTENESKYDLYQLVRETGEKKGPANIA